MNGSTIPIDSAIDAHVHVLPERLLLAIRDSLNDAAGWEITHPRGRTTLEEVFRKHGIERYIALPYAHKPGIADELNTWLQDQAAESEMCIPFATVHPEDDVRTVVREAFEAGARGLKFQCPVQKVAPDDSRLDPAYELCAEYDRPVLHHAGSAPMFTDSPYVGVDRFQSFRDSFPEVRACCAHMGVFEHEAFIDLARDDANVFLDTCFSMSTVVGDYIDFDPASIDDAIFEDLAGRVLYGSDYPNVPHAYRREYEGLVNRDLSATAADALFHDAAIRFLGDDFQ